MLPNRTVLALRSFRRSATILLLAGALFTHQQAHGQKRILTENLPNFDLRPFHFGFLLSYNTADFFMKLKPGAVFADSLLTVDHIAQPGFNLGIVSSFNMTPNLSVRFLPTLSFQDRILSYRFRKSDGKPIGFGHTEQLLMGPYNPFNWPADRYVGL